MSSPERAPAPARRPVFPFAAIVGQEEMKSALLLNAVDPGIRGVIVMGHRGTAKSTAVRALTALLPPIPAEELHAEVVVRGQVSRVPLGEPHAAGATVPVPVVDLPLGATEDRVVGTLDIEAALSRGVKAFEPGLLARADRGFLYIDEVNLLEDHLVDLLLDAAASGVNLVEREGLSVRHPARFVLVGSGNPEEGDLRPQLLDRFGLHAEIVTLESLDDRVKVVQRTEAFRRNPEDFVEQWEPQQLALRERIVQARRAAPDVVVAHELLLRITELCHRLRIDGHRGEITMTRAARAHAALQGRAEATVEDARAVAPMALRHRLRRDPLESVGSTKKIADAMNELLPAA